MLSMLASATKVFETTRQPFLVLDGRFRVVAANQAFWTRFCLDPDDTLGGLLSAAGHGEWDAAPVHRLLEELLPAQHEVEGFELIGEFGSGARMIMLVDARELGGDDRNVDRLILLGFHDVTEARRTESLVKRTRLDLERSNRELQEFASVASHDLQEPLRKILAFGERLQARAASSLDEVAADYLTRMLDASRRMRRLIDDALECARLSTGTTHVEAVALDAAVRGAMDNLSVPVGSTMDVGPMPTIEADPAQMRQLFQNLLSNACKFRRPAVPLAVTVRAERPGVDDPWTITVADNGLGFEPLHAERLFTMFQRLHGRQFEGSGIGLAVCRRIVEGHHGSIEARGAPDAGASFVMRLPECQIDDSL
jgi:signal transduction histidine kinase